MSATTRPRRTVLYLPGSNARALEKARSLATDALILDLEDAVAPDAKSTAREQVAAAVTAGGFGHREVLVRVNGADTDWFEPDIAAVAAAPPDGVLVPKVSSAADVAEVEAALSAAGAPDGLPMWAMLETPRAVLDAAAITAASDRLVGFVMGTNDLAKELRSAHVPGRAPLLTSLAWCLLAVRDAGKTIVDGVYNDLDDAEGFAAECRQAVELGFDGKTVIHPRQLDACNAAFTPTDSEVAHASRVIEAFEAASAEGKGVVTVDGKLIENLHVEQARRTLAVVEAVAAQGD
ncbi:MAG: CoA ester lyase [Nitriliruptor sp.]|nr:MAG: CoA ester lyase [Nitriliruptor sp.]